MDIESFLEKFKFSGKDFISISFLSASLLMSGCTKEEKIIYQEQEDETKKQLVAPTILNAIPGSIEPNRKVQLIIQDNSENEEGFILERRKEQNSFKRVRSFEPQSGVLNTFFYDDIGLEKSTDYTYRVKVYNSSLDSDWDLFYVTSVGPQFGFIEVKTNKDAHVEKDFLNTNLGDERNLALSKNYVFPPNNEQEIFLSFLLPSIPLYSIGFSSATLRLADASGGNTIYPGEMEIQVGKALNSWSENLITWSNKPDVLFYSTTHTSYNPNTEKFVLIDVSEIVSSFYSNSINNHGFGIKTPTNQRYASFYSKEGYYPGSPNLTIVYEW